MDSDYSMQKIIMIAITLVVIAIILPIGLVYIGTAGDTTVQMTQIINDSTGELGQVNVTLTEAVDPAIITLLTILLPILVVIVIIMYFLPKTRKSI